VQKGSSNKSRKSKIKHRLVVTQQSAQAEQLLHAGTMQKQLANTGSESSAPAKGFFVRMFGKNKQK